MPDATRSCVAVDSHPAILAFLEAFLESHGYEPVALEPTGSRGIAALRRHRPDILIVDLHLPDIPGLDVVAAALETGSRALVYTGLAGRSEVAAALEAGVSAIVSKEAPICDLGVALDRLATGRPYVDAVLAGEIHAARDAEVRLTPRERQVLRALSHGASYARCAHDLGVAEATVRTHARHAIVSLGARNRSQAVATALRLSLIG